MEVHSQISQHIHPENNTCFHGNTFFVLSIINSHDSTMRINMFRFYWMHAVLDFYYAI